MTGAAGAGAAAGAGGAREPRPLPLQQHELHHQQMKIGIPTTQIKQQRKNQRKAELSSDEDESMLLHALSVVADGYLVA